MSSTSSIIRVLQVWWRPLPAYRDLRDQASPGGLLALSWLLVTMNIWLASRIAGGVPVGRRGRAGEVGLIGELAQSGLAGGMVVLFVAVVCVPYVILLSGLFERRLSLVLMMRGEFAPMLRCGLTALAGSALPGVVGLALLVVIGWALPGGLVAPIALFLMMALLVVLFAVQMSFAIVAVFSAGWPAAFMVSLLSLTSLIALPLFLGLARTVCASPLLVLFILFMLRDRVDDVLRDGRARREFRQNLQVATLNPADASAWYNLGLLHRQRGERAEARQCLEKAVGIDSEEVDAHYLLGMIAREESRLPEAISHFEQVIARDEAHSQHEVWREIAQVYFAAGQYDDSLAMLDRFQRSRPADPEGLCLKGLALDRLGRNEEAEAAMVSCIEAVESAPTYKYRQEKRWLSQAESFLRGRRSASRS